jgi:hypothetical protein
LGKWGRGERPLIFSTELARSPHEYASRTKKLQDEIIGFVWEQAKATDELKIAKFEEEIAKRRRELERAIAVYGLITCAPTAKSYWWRRSWRALVATVRSGTCTSSIS